MPGDLVAELRAPHLREVEREQVAGHQLGHEALGRRDADLGAGVGVDDRVGLARDRRAVGVADREHLGALRAGVPDRHQGVGGLAGLADRDHQGVPGEDRVAVAELVGELDLAGDPGPVLDGVLRDEAGVERGAARHDDDLVDLAELVLADPDLVELQGAGGVVAAQRRVRDRPRLLVDLLAHEPVEAVLLGGREVPVDVVGLGLGGRAVEVGDLDALAGDRDDLVLAELERVAGVLDEGGHVGGEEVLAVPDPDHERGVAAGADHAVGVLGVHRDERERALEAAAHVLHRLGEVRAGGDLGLDEVRRDLGVGLRAQVVAGRLELGAQPGEVLDDAVVHERDPAVLAEVRVRVAVVGGAVRGPARVADAGHRRGQRLVGERLVEVADLARALLERDPAVDGERHPGGVVAAVLEPPESLDHHSLGLLRAHVTDDSTHGRNSTGGGPRSPPGRRTGQNAGHGLCERHRRRP